MMVLALLITLLPSLMTLVPSLMMLLSITHDAGAITHDARLFEYSYVYSNILPSARLFKSFSPLLDLQILYPTLYPTRRSIIQIFLRSIIPISAAINHNSANHSHDPRQELEVCA